MKPVRVALALFPALAAAQLVKDWRSVRTQHVEIVSRYEAARTRAVAEHLQWVRGVLETHLETKPGERQALILIPDSPYDFEQLAPEGSAGYFQGAPWRDLIVIKEFVGVRDVATHEYTHLAMHHRGGSWAPWFNEGMAEYFSTLKQTPAGAEAGAPPSRVRVLRKAGWVPPATLMDPRARDWAATADARQFFYAQSWLYVHMLRHAPAYKTRFAEFLTLMAQGVNGVEALKRLYRKSPAEFDDEARGWFNQKTYPVETLKAAPAAFKTEERVLSALEVDVARATVAAAQQARSKTAGEYARLSRLGANQCVLAAPLGDLAFAAQLFREAAVQFEEAKKCGGGAANAALIQGLETALRSGAKIAESEDVRVLITRASPGRVHYLLATGHFFAGNWEGALKELSQVEKLPPVDNFRALRIKTLALLELKRFDEARKALEELTAASGDEEQRSTVTLAREEVDRAIARPAEEPFHRAVLRSLTRVDGDVTFIDCMGDKANFTVTSSGVKKRFRIADPSGLVSVHNGVAGVPLEFGCGAQKRAVTIGYKSAPGSGFDGDIVYLEFR